MKKKTAQTASRVSSHYSQNETLTHVRPAHLSPQPEASPTYLVTLLALWSSYCSPVTELLPLPGKLSLECLSPLDIQVSAKIPLLRGTFLFTGPERPWLHTSYPQHSWSHYYIFFFFSFSEIFIFQKFTVMFLLLQCKMGITILNLPQIKCNVCRPPGTDWHSLIWKALYQFELYY